MPDTKPREPRTKREWQEAADLALFWLKIDDLRKYGVLQGGPTVNAERCEQIIAAAARRGIHPVEGVPNA
jgi:hypothetical protein